MCTILSQSSIIALANFGEKVPDKPLPKMIGNAFCFVFHSLVTRPQCCWYFCFIQKHHYQLIITKIGRLRKQVQINHSTQDKQVAFLAFTEKNCKCEVCSGCNDYRVCVCICECVMLCVVLATVDSHVPEAPTKNWVGGASQISIHNVMWNVSNPQEWWGIC